MKNKAMIWVFALLSVYALAGSIDAARIGVVIEFPGDRIYAKCVSVDDSASGYDVLEGAGANIAWSSYPLFGHGLCGINQTGCPASNCYCNANEYWNFYIKGPGAAQWTYSPVGFDGGSTCNDHFCASDGGMIGLGFGAYGTTPDNYQFDQVCCDLAGDESPCGTVTLGEIINYINAWNSGNAELGSVIDLIDAWMTA